MALSFCKRIYLTRTVFSLSMCAALVACGEGSVDTALGALENVTNTETTSSSGPLDQTPAAAMPGNSDSIDTTDTNETTDPTDTGDSVERVIVPTSGIPVEPIVIVPVNSIPSISGIASTSAAVESDYEFRPLVIDADDDILLYNATGLPEWMAIDPSTGRLFGNPGYEHAGHVATIKLSVRDTEGAVATLPEFSVSVTADPIELALYTGDVRPVTDEVSIVSATLTSIDDAQGILDDAVYEIFQVAPPGTVGGIDIPLTGLSWEPTHDAALLSATFGLNRSVLNTNATFKEGNSVYSRDLAVIGEDFARYMVMGGNPMRNHRRDSSLLNEPMHEFMVNSVKWLVKRDDFSKAPLKVVIANMDDSFYFPDDSGVREWLDERFTGQVTYNVKDVCDDLNLAGCMTGDTDLLIVSQHYATDVEPTDTLAAVTAAYEQGLPVLYLHHNGNLTDLGSALLNLFDVNYERDNFWPKLSIVDFEKSPETDALPENVAAIRTLVQHLQDQDYEFDWYECDDENCSNVTGFQNEFQAGADETRTLFTALDESRTDLFSRDGYRFQKLLALLGDFYRQRTVFPMDKFDTAQHEFFSAYFADHAVYNYRTVNPVQPDMGNFSRSDFAHITPVDKSVVLTSKQKFRAAGVYALPGQTVSVTRNDTSDVTVKIRVNTQRSGSTHEWADYGYKRPKFLKSSSMEIASGETIQLTSPYGGPLQVEFSENDLPVDLLFSNVGEHAYWDGPEYDNSFTAKLNADEFDWAELITPGFQVHSTRQKMIESMSDEVVANGVAADLAAMATRHIHNYPHVLAGYTGPGIDAVTEIHQFAADKGFSIDNIDLVKHMNADQATCGSGCSGNPYDAYWSFNPLGHGDLHELGHGLERWRFRFDDWPVHASTNMYSYYSKSRFFSETGNEPVCQNLSFEALYGHLQTSLTQADAAAYIQAALWDQNSWKYGATMFVQMLMSAQDSGALENGWHLLSRLHILEREFNRATNDNDLWLAKRESLGFSQYTATDAKLLDQNDWLLIAVSVATGFDYSDYFDVWSHDYSAEAAAQVASLGLPAQPVYYYVSSGEGFCKGEGFDGRRLPIDTVSVWPLPTEL